MIVDTFPFNRDFAALEIRLAELSGIVDKFIISQSNISHSGKEKPIYLKDDHELIKKYQGKIILTVNTGNKFTKNPRIREMLQRERITKEIEKLKLSPQTLIIHSDCDEIPRSTIIENLYSTKQNVDALLELRNYSNFINLSNGLWARGRVQSFSLFRGIQAMRQDIFLMMASKQKASNVPLYKVPDYWTTRRYGMHKFPIWTILRKIEIIKEGGWHFNNLLEPHELLAKIENSCHTELNTLAIKSAAIDNYYSGRDIYTGEKMHLVDVDSSYPRYIQENTEKFAKFIYSDLLKVNTDE